MKRSYLSIGLSIVFYSQLFDVILKFIAALFFSQESNILIPIIIVITTCFEIVGLFVAKKDYEGAKRAIPILVVQIVAEVFMYVLYIVGGEYANGVLSCIEIIFDTISTLVIISIIKEVYIARELEVRFIKLVSVVIVIDALVGLFATLWSKELAEGANVFKVAAILLLALAIITDGVTYVLFLIVVGKAVNAKTIREPNIIQE